MADASMRLGDELPELMPTDDDVARYDEVGWYLSPPVLTDESIDAVLAAIDRHYAGATTRDLPISDRISQWRPGDDPAALRNDEFISLRNDEIARFLHQPVLAAIAARLMRSPTARLFSDSLIYKPAGDESGTAATGWHRDRAYWSTCTSDSMTTAWVPLYDVPVDGGPLSYLDGSHRWDGFDHLRSFKDLDLGGFEQRLREQGHDVSITDAAVHRGCVVFHHARTIHASRPNRTDRPRVAFAVHYQPADNRYRSAVGPDGAPVVLPGDLLCRATDDGTPDYTDDAVFPLLWSEPDDGHPG